MILLGFTVCWGLTLKTFLDILEFIRLTNWICLLLPNSYNYIPQTANLDVLIDVLT